MATADDIKQVVAGAVSGAILAFIGMGTVGERVVRPDPFTGTEGAALEHRIDMLESKMGVAEYRLHKKHDDIASCNDRVDKLEKQCRENHK